ncbi:TraR/DksA C4-type zinc finger protein [Streptomyces sp. NRRL S-31]|uniref:TraR/DksA C4-type zinc finger protein n=1 Tax=Streptomyces sp. NRRL S-31 TaxID=1463898 RepID=UPI0004CAEEAD|nr:TraR/DksA C4-type zinc finger protein [Streptomyces sp. NRRL S-31]
MSLDVTRAGAGLHPHEARRRLEHAHTSRLAQLKALDETGRSTDDPLLAEQKTAVRQILEEIAEAFARLEEGTYGTCLACAKPIPAERLEILPYTRHCVACRLRAA